jgi:hypothetical protein
MMMTMSVLVAWISHRVAWPLQQGLQAYWRDQSYHRQNASKGYQKPEGHTREQDEVDGWTVGLTAGI